MLIIACPCALGLATPTALTVGIGRGAQLGIVIRGPEVLEQTKRIDTIVLDKTGHRHRGSMRLENGLPPEVLRLAGAVEAASEHPSHTRSSGGASGSGRCLRPRVPSLPAEASWESSRDGASRSTATACGSTATPPATSSSATPSSRRAPAGRPRACTSARARAPHRRLAATAERVAAEVGVERVFAEVLPDGKAAEVGRLHAEGRSLRWSATGSTTRPPSRRRTLGLAIGTGTDVAIEASDLTLVSGDLRAAADAIRLARAPSHDQGQPVLGLRLQRRRDPARSPDCSTHRRSGRNGVLERLRRHQPPAAPPLP